MATTAHLFESLAHVGARTSAGVALASAKVRFYNTGTLVSQNVYSDSAASSVISQPITLNAAGQATVFLTGKARMIIKDSTDTTTLFDLDPVVMQRAQQVYITNAGINGGAETDLDAAVTALVAADAAADNYLESGGATSREIEAWLAEVHVSVKDFGAVGDGTADDTSAIQAAITRVAAKTGGWVFIPRGTYKITSALTNTTAGVKFRGEGIGVSIIKNFSTTANAFTFTYGNGTESRLVMEDLSITANTSTTGYGISVVSGLRAIFRRVLVTDHTNGINLANGAAAFVRHRVEDCDLKATSVMAVGVNIPANSNGCILVGCLFASCTTDGIASAAISTRIEACHFDSCTDGIDSSGNSAVIVHCTSSSNTRDLSWSGTNGYLLGNDFTIVNLGGSTTFGRGWETATQSASSASTPATLTPDFSAGAGQTRHVQFSGSHTAAAQALTVAAPTNDNELIAESLIVITLGKSGANALNITWAANYMNMDGTPFTGLPSVASATVQAVWFRKVGSSSYRVVMIGAAGAYT